MSVADMQRHRDLAVWIKVLNQTEGRDKLTKCLQYGSRVISWYLGGKNDVGRRFAALQATTGDSRKIFRLGKFANEYMRLHGIVSAYPKKHTAATRGACYPYDEKRNALISDLLLFVSRGAFLLYWVYDNLVVLTKIKFIRFGETTHLMKRAGVCWFIGLISGLILELRKLRQLTKDHRFAIRALRRTPAPASPAFTATTTTTGQGSTGSGATEAEAKEAARWTLHMEAVEAKEEQRYREKRKVCLINIIKILGDLIPASHLAHIPQRFAGRSFNDGAVGLGGFISAALTLWQLFPERPPAEALCDGVMEKKHTEDSLPTLDVPPPPSSSALSAAIVTQGHQQGGLRRSSQTSSLTSTSKKQSANDDQ